MMKKIKYQARKDGTVKEVERLTRKKASKRTLKSKPYSAMSTEEFDTICKYYHERQKGEGSTSKPNSKPLNLAQSGRK